MQNKLHLRDFNINSGKFDLQIRLVAGSGGLDKKVTVTDLNRPGLSLAGFYDFFAYERIQIFGLGETAYLQQLTEDQKYDVYEKFFSYDVVCCIFTHNVEPDPIFIEYAEKKVVPVFISKRDTTRFTTLLTHFLDEQFSPEVTLHATMVDVFGLGVLLMGRSGVGKSECALELIERGHRLIGDDMVIIKKVDESLLMGSGSPILKHNMEIRGLGIINVRDIFGIRSVRNRKRIELVVHLEEWESTKEYDRLGLEEKKYTILDIDVPYLIVPVMPGRNIPVIIETASLNQRLKKLGVYSAQELDKKIQNWIKTETETG